MLDITDTIVPRSDQMNAEDLLAGPRTFTVAAVRKTESPDQPFDILLQEFPSDRPFKPSKSMRRVMVVAWGKDAEQYVGRRMTLYRDPGVRFGGSEVGGIRISHMSHIDKPIKLALTVTRGKREPHTVQKLPDAPATPTVLSRLGQAMTEAGIGDKLAWLSEKLGREIGSARDVTPSEAEELLSGIMSDAEAAAAE